MKDIIKGFKLFRYGLQAKMIIILAIIFFVLGILFEFTDFSGSNLFSLSALYLSLTGMYIYQLVFTTTVSKLTQSSPLKKKLQTSIPAIITLSSSLFVRTVYVVIRCLRMTPEFLEENGFTWIDAYSTILFMGIFIFVFLVYCSFSYKSFVFSLILLIGIFALYIAVYDTQFSIANFCAKLLINDSNPILLIAVTYALVLLGGLLCYVISSLFYKKEISDISIRYAMRQAQSK